MLLYHGSKSGIKGDIRPNASRDTCDFGLGFYMGNKADQPKGLIATRPNGRYYEMDYNMEGLKIKEFGNTADEKIDWALFIAYNRKAVSFNSYETLKLRYDAYNALYDVIIGPIADDSMVVTLENFFSGSSTDKEMIACLQHVKLGEQYVLKTKKACSKERIKIIVDRPLRFDEKKLAKAENSQRKQQMDSILTMYRKKYRRDTSAKFIDEIMEEWNGCN